MNENFSVALSVEEITTGTHALRDLVARLSRSGYGEFYASFNPLAPRLNSWHLHRNDVPVQLRSLIDLFLLAEPVQLTNVAPVIGDLVEQLVAVGLLNVNSSGEVATPNLVLLPVFGHWLFCQRPQKNPTLYFGDDSIALLLRLRPKRRGRCLDLCSGPGIQTLQCSLFAGHVDAVEVNPIAVELARVNVLMNGCEDKVSIHLGDLYEPVKGQVYDNVVANPPLLPFPEEIAYPFVGHGGRDGLRTTRRILHGLDSALARDGVAQIVGTCLSDGILPLPTKDFDEWGQSVGMDIRMTVTSHNPLSPGEDYFEGLIATAAIALNTDSQPIASAYRRLLAEQQASHLCAYFLQITRGSGGIILQDLSRDEKHGLWYV